MSPDSLIAQEQARTPLGRSGLFLHAEDEQAFLRGEWEYIGARLRILGLWGSVAFMLAAYTDFTVLGSKPLLFGILGLRLIVLALGIRLILLGRRAEAAEHGRMARALLAFEVSVLGVFLVLVPAYGGAVDYHAITALLLTIALYAYAPALSAGSLLVGPIFTVIFLLEAVYMLRAAPQVTSIVGILLVFANFAGWQVATQLNRIQRMNWMDRNRLRREVAERLAAEKRALAGEDNLRRLFDTTPVPMVLSQQPSGKVLRYNQAAENLLDPAGKVRAGDVLFSADFFADPAEFAQQREQLLRGGRVGPLDVHLKTTDGRVVDVMLSSTVMQFHGEPATIASLVEITARKRYEHELRRLTQTDPLTGLLNRRGFFAQASKLIEGSQTSGAPIAVLLMDADHFKRVNDAHGHAVGDEALRQIGAVIQTQLRDADALARVGGEEFACLLPGMSQQKAMEVAERIRTAVGMQSMHCADVCVEISLSIGVSVVADHEQRIDEALNRADRAMYVAKRAGRNRVDIMI